MENKNWTDSDKRSWTHWFEIPASDFDRAKNFYEAIFKMEVQATDFGGFKMGIFPHNEVGCAICHGEGYTPGTEGATVYLDASPDLEAVLSQVENAGGKILQGKKQISPEHGFMALFIDSEGNKMALHSTS